MARSTVPLGATWTGGSYEALTTEAAIEHLQQLGVTAVELMPVHHHAYARHLVERWLDATGREMTDEAWNAPFVRSLGVLMVGDAIGDIDERGHVVAGHTLLILLNAHFECVPFVLAAAGDGHAWARVLDRIEAYPPVARFTGGADNRMALQVTH